MESTYRTAEELAFIRKLGTFAEATRKIPVEKLLKGYISSADKRVDWDGADAEKCIEAAEKRLANVIEGMAVK